jgi:hypothetical protein
MLSLRVLAVALSVVLVSACAGGAPDVKVLGVSEARAHRGAANDDRVLVMYVEVINDTARELRLSRMSYQMDAERWFSHRGTVPLTRVLGAHSSAVVEVPVPWVGRSAEIAVPYRLAGKLIAVDEQIERSFTVQAEGTLDPSHIAVGNPPRARMRVAGE